jgi:hypothetical protein
MPKLAQLFALSACVCVRLLGDDIALVRASEEWRYFTGTNEPASLISDWRQPGFDDSAWAKGLSGFGFGAYDATSLAYLWPDSLSFYFRKQFSVSDPAPIHWLLLRLDYQDGFVAYLNGTEIARRGLVGEPGSKVPFDAVALPHTSGAAEEILVVPATNLLVAGENLLAIQGLRRQRESYGYELTPELWANFTRGPLVQNSSTNRVQIIWKTPVAADSMVDYGMATISTSTYADANLVTNHVAALTNLAPDTLYYYRVRSSSQGDTAVSSWFTFRTLKCRGAVSFVAVGDTGYGTVGQYQIAKVMQDAAPDLVMHLGDVLYPNFTFGRVDLRCFSIYRPQMQSTPFFFGIGNHDRYDNPVDFLASFCLPTNQVTGTSHFYSFDDGDAHFVVLDTDLGQGNDWSVGSLQYRWLEADLAGATKPWKLLFFHNAIRSSGPHRYDDYNVNGIPDRIEFQNSIGALAARYGVQVIFNAHEHLYERLRPVDGVHTIVTGGGGAVLYAFGGEWDAASALFWSRYNCVKASLQGDTLELQALGQDGQIFDRVSIQRAPPPRQVFQATWNTPVIEAPDDGHSNAAPQQFSLVGQPIPAAGGQFSNMGRCYVNNDSNALYLGFEHVMIYNSNNLFLFLESPRLPGVANLLATGNGLIDPQGQGADGLDILANLAFTNFVPAIGCILGDDNGSGQFRSFVRTNLELNIGQGAFSLGPELTGIEGVRLRQFNLSPWICRAPDDHNAEFIEMAIPLAALGGLRPGETIKLGAVVAGNAYNISFGAQTRFLDTSFLGYSLHGSGQGPVALEGLEVRLANSAPVEPGLPPRMGIELLTNDQARLFWSAVIGRRYQLEYAETQASRFVPVPDPIFPRAATSSVESYIILLPPDRGQPAARFYRVRGAPDVAN